MEGHFDVPNVCPLFLLNDFADFVKVLEEQVFDVVARRAVKVEVIMGRRIEAVRMPWNADFLNHIMVGQLV